MVRRGVKEAICVHLEKPSLSRGGGLRHHLSATYYVVLGAYLQLSEAELCVGWIVRADVGGGLSQIF